MPNEFSNRSTKNKVRAAISRWLKIDTFHPFISKLKVMLRVIYVGIIISALFSWISFDLHAPTRRYIHQMRALSQLVLLIYRSCSGNLGKKSSKKSWKSADQLMTGSNLTMSMRKRFRKFLQMISPIYREFGRRYLFLFLLFLIFRRSEMIMPSYLSPFSRKKLHRIIA